ncbi:TreTu family toxin [Pseudoduganella sp. LjRoot289]|uniref:TreTu family toxin n=1 Tax=Pseudoduganella sp. LjRoot289 TaxID=3342314 RepID=UPI003F4F400C
MATELACIYSAGQARVAYVEFDVPNCCLSVTGAGWAKIIGPNSVERRLAAVKGRPVRLCRLPLTSRC